MRAVVSKGFRTKIERSPHRWEIERRILRNQHPREISQWLKETDPPESISEDSILRHKSRLKAESALIGLRSYDELHRNVDARFDALQQLYNIIVVQMGRCRLTVGTEFIEGKATPAGRADQDLLFSMVERAVKIEMDLGIRKRVSSEQGMNMLEAIEEFQAKANVQQGGAEQHFVPSDS